MKKNYYSFKEIKTKFKSYKELKELNITEKEYDKFCDEIQVLPKEIVDKVQTEIQFVLLSANPKKLNPACYVNLRKEFDKEKVAIIVLTPYIFGAIYIGKSGEQKIIDEPCILYEIAHHILGHYKYEDQQDFEKKEKDARKLAQKWVDQWIKFI